MNRSLRGRPHVFARLALLAYLAYLAVCASAYVLAAPGREWQGLLRFLLEVACGLPWTLPLLSLPAILVPFDLRVSGDGFVAMVHALAVLGVGINLLVLNRLCDWRGILRIQPFQATS